MESSRELVNRLFSSERIDRIPLYDFWWPETTPKWAKEQGYPTDSQGNAVDPFEYFGFDMYPLPEPLKDIYIDAMPSRGVNEVLEETSEWTISVNGAGAALKWWKNQSGAPEHIDFRMTNRKIWETDYRSHLLSLDRERVYIEKAANGLNYVREHKRWAHFGSGFVWEYLRASMGDLCMYESLLLDPDWIHDFNRVYTDFWKAHYEVLFEEAGLPDGIVIYEDLGYKNGLACSPAVLEKMIFPYHKELVDFFHRRGLFVILHSCGNIEDALPLIIDAGFDGLNPMEVKAGCDVIRFAEKCQDKLVFVGGFDVRIIETNDNAYIRKTVTDFLGRIKSVGARYIFGTDHSVSPLINYNTFQYLLDVYREHMYY